MLERAQRGPIALYCFSSNWEQRRVASGELYRVDEQRCGFDLEQVKWTIFPNVVNGQFRCEVDGVVAEYSVQYFRKNDTVYGEYFCNTGQYPTSEHHEYGSVTDIMALPY